MTVRGASSVCRADVDPELTQGMVPALADQPFVGIVAALPAEARCLVRSDAPVGARCVVNARVRVHVGGIGAAAARQAATSLIADGAAALVSWGFAAGLEDTLAAGTLVISDRVVAASETTSARDRRDGFDATASATASASPSTSRAWAARLSTRLGRTVPIVHGAIVCPEHVVRTADEKRALGASGAVAADMETAAIASVAVAAGVPWLAMRVVVDTIDMVVPASVASAIDAAGKVQMVRLLHGLLCRPSDLASLPALARAYRRAMRTLEIVGRVAVDGLLIPDSVARGAGAAEHHR